MPRKDHQIHKINKLCFHLFLLFNVEKVEVKDIVVEVSCTHFLKIFSFCRNDLQGHFWNS